MLLKQGGRRYFSHKERPIWGTPSVSSPRLLDQISIVCRRRQLSDKTEQAYRYWTRQFVLFHGKRHPKEWGPTEVEAFLNHLAVERRVAASTQAQALNGIVFLYEHKKKHPKKQKTKKKRKQHQKHDPVVLTCE